jgi:uncharacterized protein YjbI with pentapeptide repeats
VILENADLTDVRFDIHPQNGQIERTILDGAIMRGADLSGSYLAGGALAGADLTQSDLSRSTSAPVTIVDNRLIGGITQTLKAVLYGANLSGADFQSAKLANADLRGLVLARANFRHADLREADLSAVDLAGADLRGANLRGANMDDSSLLGAKLAGTNLSATDLSKVNLDGVSLWSTTPVTFNADLTYAELFRFLAQSDCLNGVFLIANDNAVADVPVRFDEDAGGDFYYSEIWRNARDYICAANLSETRMWGKRFLPTSMAGVNLSSADLSFTDLREVVFEETIEMENNLSYNLKANLNKIVYNSFTSWPSDFIPPPSASPE